MVRECGEEVESAHTNTGLIVETTEGKRESDQQEAVIAFCATDEGKARTANAFNLKPRAVGK